MWIVHQNLRPVNLDAFRTIAINAFPDGDRRWVVEGIRLNDACVIASFATEDEAKQYMVRLLQVIRPKDPEHQRYPAWKSLKESYEDEKRNAS